MSERGVEKNKVFLRPNKQQKLALDQLLQSPMVSSNKIKHQ